MQLRFSVIVFLVTLCLLLGIVASSANVYTGLNVGVSWDWGGVEVLPSPGLYLCRHAYNTGTHTSEPMLPAIVLPTLVTDC